MNFRAIEPNITYRQIVRADDRGWLGIEEGVMKVAYTNVTYYVSDSIEIRKDSGLETW